MERNSFRQILIVALFLLLTFVNIQAYGQHSWPIDPMDQGHSIGNSFGEFQDWPNSCYDKNGYPMEHCVYQHSGIDIIGTPLYKFNGTEDPSAPWVRVTVGGVVEDLINIPNTDINLTIIRDSKGIIHTYAHLEHNSYDPTFVDAFNNQTITAERDAIARLYRWNKCDYHHLHYEMERNGKFLNPVASIVPHADSDPPEIADIIFAKNNSEPWSNFERATPTVCTLVSGELDIIAEIRDRDRAGSNHPSTETLWVYNIRWRACHESYPNCPWVDTYPLDEIPTDWGIVNRNNQYTSAYFSANSPWISDSDYCRKTSLYAVVTNFVGGIPDKTGCWDTGKIPDGKYIVSVEATDFAGKTAMSSVNVCVRNNVPPSAPKDLRIR